MPRSRPSGRRRLAGTCAGRWDFRSAWTTPSAEVFGLELDRLAVRRAVGGVVPGVVVARERLGRRHALLGDQTLQRGEPVMVVGLASVGIARRLRALDLLAE